MGKWPVILGAAALCSLLCVSCGRVSSSPSSVQAPAPPPSAPAFTLDEDVNPYTGLAKTEGYPEGQRGVAVMLGNMKEDLPQSGLNAADLVYEMITEGGITRLMAVYRDRSALPLVGPLRSARDQHVQLMIPLNCLYVHIGGSSYALDMLDAFHCTDVRSINGRYKNFYWIDAERRRTRSQENSVYTDGSTLESALERYGLETEGEPDPVFNFQSYEEAPRALDDGIAYSLSFRFSPYEDVRFDYSTEDGRYYKSEFGQPQLDAADGGRQYRVDNVFLLFTSIGRYPDGLLSQVNLEQGVGFYFSQGRYERVRWMKGRGEAPLRIVDDEGHEQDVTVNPGTSYISFVGDDLLAHCRIGDATLEELYGA